MKILHVITRLILGGAQQNTVMSCAAQVSAGHDVHLAYGPIHGPEGSLLDEAKASGTTLHEIPTLVREIAPLTDWRCYRELQKLVRELRPDVVHTHSSKAGILGRAAAWSQRRTPPRDPAASEGLLEAVESGNLSDELSERMGREFLRRSVGTRPKVVHTVHGLPFHTRQNPLVRRFYVALERHAAKRCDQLVAITPAMLREFVKAGITHHGKFKIIPSGVDLDRFATDLPRGEAKRRFDLNPAYPTIGLVARLDPLKGHSDLIDALPAIVEAVPDTRVVFVGDGFDHASVLDKIEASPVRQRVRMLDLVPFARMPEMYRALDVCVLPSYQEGQSRVLVEALAAGCGIVGYDVGGIPAVCVHERTGLLVPVGDTDRLADAVVRMLTDEALRKRTVEAGQTHVREHFGAEKMNRELLALYERLLGGGRVA
ncbi:MAG: glycosyltransferase family 4 protein [Planctomycetota bacterium]